MTQPLFGPPIEYRGRLWDVQYRDSDFSDLPEYPVTQVYGVCFYGNRMLIGLGPRNRWAILGGTPAPRETWQDALKREIVEEANMLVTSCQPLGYQLLTLQGRDPGAGPRRIIQLRAFATIEPLGEFQPSPSVLQIKLIDPSTAHEFFNWGPIGDRLIARGALLARH